MNISEHDSITLMQQEANREIVESLYQHNFINQDAKDHVLELLYPHHQWGYWTSKILQTLGFILLITGMVYFFAFNWERMSPAYKLISIEAALICCVAGAWAFSLSRLVGQLFLTGACVLVGIFLAVFGQIYQTGADAYQLFLIWTLLTLPWVCIGQFSPLWFAWIVLLNITVILSWEQTFLPKRGDFHIDAILIGLNTFILFLREYLCAQDREWLQARAYRILLAIAILLLALISIETMITTYSLTNKSLVASTCLGVLIHLIFLAFYRYKVIDMWVFSATIISIAIILCSIANRIIFKYSISDVTQWSLMSLAVMIIFATAVYVLRKSSPPPLPKEGLIS
ncbi:MAG: hypothetical protein BGO43_15835 [Gammaproteobacteria bacterium 39-13]|nr:DUF2157 domain-containing protein [Gammaproteobacteria bacterium]OJV87879.1 MAG: hypothetical protein BGO43_15835 [Gammaproteobacteria bacterium 39-13]